MSDLKTGAVITNGISEFVQGTSYDLRLAKASGTIRPGASVALEVKETIHIKPGFEGRISIRRSYGDKALFINAVTIHGGDTVNPKLFILNGGANDVEIRENDCVVQLTVTVAANIVSE